jgi:flagellar motor switch protein FliM
MDRTLNQEEFDALLRMVEGRKAQASKEPGHQSAVPYDFRRTGILAKEQAQAIRSLHETFARNLTGSLGQYLHGSFETALVSLEQISYFEFVQHIPKLDYVASILLHPLQATAVAELDLTLALPLIDMLLGGTGSPVSEVRELTEIEEEILGSVVQLICRELEAVWLPVLKLDFRFERRQGQAQLLRLLPPNERVLALSLEVRTTEVRGMLNLVFPTAAVRALLRQLDGQASCPKPADASSGNRRLRSLLEECRFHAELVSPTAAVPARKLVHLKVGEVLEFPFTVATPTLFKVENQTLFLAQPVSIGDRRAAEIHSKPATPQLTKEEPN